MNFKRLSFGINKISCILVKPVMQEILYCYFIFSVLFQNKFIKAFLAALYKNADGELLLCDGSLDVGDSLAVNGYTALLDCASALRL